MSSARASGAAAAALISLLLFSLVSPGPAWASFGFNPILMRLDPRSPIGTFTITNNEAVAKIIQVELNRWEQHDGQDTLTKSDDLVVSPPVFTLAPNDRQIIRVGTRTRTGRSGEKAYRIVVSEAPVENTSRIGVSVQMRVNVPVFVAATTENAAKPIWRVRRIDAGHVSVSVDNVSETHLHVVRLELLQRKKAVGTLRDGSYILAGERHAWTVELARPVDEAAPISVSVADDFGVETFRTAVPQP